MDNKVGKIMTNMDKYIEKSLREGFLKVIFGFLFTDMSEIVNRVTRYLNSASHVLQLPIAEAMITYKEKRHSRYETLNF